MKLSVVIPALNQFQLTEKTLEYLSQDAKRPYELIVIDNGSDEEFTTKLSDVKIVHIDTAIGNYPCFEIGLTESTGDIICFIHSDLFIYEQGWEKRLLAEFERDEKLGLVGCVWSTEIDGAGGRGLGTASNFQGKRTYKSTTFQGENRSYSYWEGSPAEPHGRRVKGFEYAAVVDGCMMAFRRQALIDIGFRDAFPLFHFYDKLMSCQILEKGWRVGGLGIETDHLSGQTTNSEPKYTEAAKNWIVDHHISPGGIGTDWKQLVYNEAEKQWLSEYRDSKHFIPLKVNSHGQIC